MIQHKIDYSIALMQKAERMALNYHPDGFHLAFSGGKDSLVIYHLAKMAGVKFKAHMQLTSVDPPKLLRFIRTQYPDVQLHRPEMSMYDLILKNKCLPYRHVRFCCACLKEQAGAGTVTILGIRAEESSRRAKRSEFEIQGKHGDALPIRRHFRMVDIQQISQGIPGRQTAVSDSIFPATPFNHIKYERVQLYNAKKIPTNVRSVIIVHRKSNLSEVLPHSFFQNQPKKGGRYRKTANQKSTIKNIKCRHIIYYILFFIYIFFTRWP